MLGHVQQVGLGAQLPEPSVELFLDTLRLGGDVTVGLEAKTGAIGLAELLEESGIGLLIFDGGSGREAELVRRFRGTGGAQDRFVAIQSTQEPQPAPAGDPTIYLGVDEQLPILIAMRGEPGLLDPRRAGLPGVVSPYDLLRLIAAQLELELPETTPGADVAVVPRSEALHEALELRARFLDDLAWRGALAGTAAALIIAACVLGMVASMRRGALRTARNAGGAIVGAFVGSFAATVLPLGPLAPRIAVLVVCVALGGSFPTARTYRLAAVVLLAGLASLTVLAAARGEGEPALSLWPSPLHASRSAGLLNGYVVLLIGAVLLLGATGWGSRWPRAAIATGVIAIVGAPQLGANYGGVVLAVVAFAVTAAIVRGGRLRIRDLLVAGAAGGVVLLAALALDVGGQTHAGGALETLRTDGIAGAWELLRGRWATSAVVTGRFGAIAWIGFAGMLPILVLLLVGVIAPHRVSLLERVSLRARAAIGGLVVAGFAALLVEDTGFLTAGSLLGFAFAILLYDVAPPPPARAPVPAIVPSGAAG